MTATNIRNKNPLRGAGRSGSSETKKPVGTTPLPSKAVCGKGIPPVCLTCLGAKDDKDCFFKGFLKTCPDDTYTCVRRTYLNAAGQLRISRNCGKLAKCPAFPDKCRPEKEASKSCSKCKFEDMSLFSNCTLTERSTCRLAGDPHCKQFDALDGEPLVNLIGHCKYNMVTTYCAPGQGLGWFELHASFTPAKDRNGQNTGNSYAQKLSITYHEDMYMFENGIIDLFAFGPITLPFQKLGMSITQSNGIYIFSMAEGISVEWDGTHKVNANVPQTIHVCGLCGQHTKVFQGADLRAGPSYKAHYCKNMNVTSDTTPFNGMAVSKTEWMNSWYIGQNGQDECAAECGF
ncbi:hypothetical protein CAPTEDRAFT_206091 [Capitella teleta]|uniref:VWFD domain-containing protein n=1 Tax=Capitella teleta TaxID=283909 RepID=R7TUJ4_CAPTE|nr:hypothetical protein CAPTEDRAFT_206091 [Capitella teleta]|eukprot:ELT97324.1 hypothetical protein CAPTEDRAFT_206091 [Capitella teleta]